MYVTEGIKAESNKILNKTLPVLATETKRPQQYMNKMWQIDESPTQVRSFEPIDYLLE